LEGFVEFMWSGLHAVDDEVTPGRMEHDQLQQRRVGGEPENPRSRRVIVDYRVVDMNVFECVEDIPIRIPPLASGGMDPLLIIVTRYWCGDSLLPTTLVSACSAACG
jgi:hypothetical protein